MIEALALFYLLTGPTLQPTGLSFGVRGVVECEAFFHYPDSIEPVFSGTAACYSATGGMIGAYYAKPEIIAPDAGRKEE